MVGLWNIPAQIFAVRLGPGISWLQKMLADNLYFGLLISNSHGPFMFYLQKPLPFFSLPFKHFVPPPISHLNEPFQRESDCSHFYRKEFIKKIQGKFTFIPNLFDLRMIFGSVFLFFPRYQKKTRPCLTGDRVPAGGGGVGGVELTGSITVHVPSLHSLYNLTQSFIQPLSY